MEQHRAQSVLAYQRPSHFQFRASKFVHKIATRVLTFKKRDSHGNSPYMSSKDATKPYMSQPMINLHAAGPSTDGNESSRSGSPCTIPPESLLSPHAIATGLVPGIHAGVVVGGRGVSVDLGSDQQRQPQGGQRPVASAGATAVANGDSPVAVSKASSVPRSSVSVDLSSDQHKQSQDGQQQHPSPDGTPVTSGTPQSTVSNASPTPRLKHMKEVISGRTTIDTPLRQSRISHEGNPPSGTVPPHEPASPKSGLPATSSAVPPALPPSISRRVTPPRLESLPSQIPDPSQSAMRPSDMQAASVPAKSSYPRAAAANIPASFARTPSGAARLSPSVVTSYRTPPLLLRLPALPPPTSSPPDDAAGRRVRSEALRGVMPQLSLQGGAHENDNDGDGSSSGSDDDGDDDEQEDTEREQATSSTESFHSALQSARTSQVPTQAPVVPDSSAVTPGAGATRGESMKTPTSRGMHAASANDYFSYPSAREGEWTPGSPLRTPMQRDSQMPFSVPIPNVKVMPPLPTPGGTGRPTIYKQASRSMIDILPRSPSPEEFVPQPKAKVGPRPTTAAGKTRPGRREGKQKVRLDEERHTSPILAKQQGDEKKPAAPPIPTYEAAAAAGLRRRRSMPTFSGASSEPPPYPSYPFPHPHHRPVPREDEGREPLPAYTNDILLKAIMPRKMEFSKPGVQARDRKWRRVMCVLEGTMFRVYDCPREISGVGTLEDWWERKVGVGDIAAGQPGPNVNGTIVTTNGAAAGGVGSAQAAAAAGQAPGAGKLEDSGPGPQTARLTVPISTAPVPAPPLSAPLQQPALPAATRSRLNLVNRLRSRSHGRSVSDVSNMANPVAAGSRPSLSAAGGNGSSSDTEGRSASSSSRLTVGGGSSAATGASNASTRSSRRSSFLPGMRSGSQDRKRVPDPKPSDLIKVYTLQHAESGLGNDYFKRKNVIRVRMEGEQFLLQAKDISEVVEWIEGLQAAANIALDLDERPMPRGPLFPRRRRRRGARRNTEAGGENANANTTNAPRSPPLA